MREINDNEDGTGQDLAALPIFGLPYTDKLLCSQHFFLPAAFPSDGPLLEIPLIRAMQGALLFTFLRRLQENV